MVGPRGVRIVLVVSCLVGVWLCAQEMDAGWRSALYPEDWAPGYQDAEGHFLHDVSYAGYRNGDVPIPQQVPGLSVEAAVEAGADPAGASDATPAIQKAIALVEKAGGGTVSIPAGSFRCDGLLTVARSGVVLRGAGPEATRLFFTRVKGMRGKSHITFRGAVRTAAEFPLARDGKNLSKTVDITGVDGLAVGDDISVGWVITDAFVREHRMEGTWKAFNGKWRPFFRRRIMAVEPVEGGLRLTLDVPLRYRALVRDKASVRKESGYLTECGLEGLSVATAVAWDDAWQENRVHAIALRAVCDSWVRDVSSYTSPLPEAKGYHLQNGGIYVGDSKRVTVAQCHMAKAQHRGGGGCGYLFEIGRSSELLTRDCTGRDGRHNFIQNWDFGTSGCVWLRCTSSGSRDVKSAKAPISFAAYCEYHHSLTMACLVDHCVLKDGWYGGNRHHWSSGAGHSVTQSIYWNTSGGGKIRSWQYGLGYIIGTRDITIKTGKFDRSAQGAGPEDFVEGKGRGGTLQPQSLYEDQLVCRHARGEWLFQARGE
ncbi:MAG: hypothetical protein HN742_25830 [Lentisphaerae bacterium]|jgi:hypothetical protein|nr:hypothetical protein [Lentisphaerota bacterium]MBT5610228.1 hypothetical protein [Lentisphaerota bacterium]MBT7845321.1 hypothetical protein [Lentisphaerota bacterium]